MPYEVRAYTKRYAPWEEWQDEPEHIGTDDETETFDHLSEVGAWLKKRSIVETSDHPVIDGRTWLIAETYMHPYTGEREEFTAHRGDGFTDREWLAVVRHALR